MHTLLVFCAVATIVGTGLVSASVRAASLQFLPGGITGGASPALLMGAAAYAAVLWLFPDPAVAVR